MDIGTRDDPGRELDANAVRDVSGGHIMPDDDPPIDPLGSGGAPVDYSAVSGGEEAPAAEPDTSGNPIVRVLEDWFGGSPDR
jgi:hypothetical protein